MVPYGCLFQHLLVLDSLVPCPSPPMSKWCVTREILRVLVVNPADVTLAMRRRKHLAILPCWTILFYVLHNASTRLVTKLHVVVFSLTTQVYTPPTKYSLWLSQGQNCSIVLWTPWRFQHGTCWTLSPTPHEVCVCRMRLTEAYVV